MSESCTKVNEDFQKNLGDISKNPVQFLKNYMDSFKDQIEKLKIETCRTNKDYCTGLGQCKESGGKWYWPFKIHAGRQVNESQVGCEQVAIYASFSATTTNILTCNTTSIQGTVNYKTYQLNQITFNFENARIDELDVSVIQSNKNKVQIRNFMDTKITTNIANDISNAIQQMSTMIQNIDTTKTGTDTSPSDKDAQKSLQEFINTVTTNITNLNMLNIINSIVSDIMQENRLTVNVTNSRIKKYKYTATQENINEGILEQITNAVVDSVFKNTVINDIDQEARTEQSSKKKIIVFSIIGIILFILFVVGMYYLIRFLMNKSKKGMKYAI